MKMNEHENQIIVYHAATQCVQNLVVGEICGYFLGNFALGEDARRLEREIASNMKGLGL